MKLLVAEYAPSYVSRLNAWYFGPSRRLSSAPMVAPLKKLFSLSPPWATWISCAQTTAFAPGAMVLSAQSRLAAIRLSRSGTFSVSFPRVACRIRLAACTAHSTCVESARVGESAIQPWRCSLTSRRTSSALSRQRERVVSASCGVDQVGIAR